MRKAEGNFLNFHRCQSHRLLYQRQLLCQPSSSLNTPFSGNVEARGGVSRAFSFVSCSNLHFVILSNNLLYSKVGMKFLCVDMTMLGSLYLVCDPNDAPADQSRYVQTKVLSSNGQMVQKPFDRLAATTTYR